MKQHVLIAHNDYQIAGGEGNVAESEARMLRNHGHPVTVYRRDNAEIASYGVVKKCGLAFATFFSLRTYREIRALIRSERIDIVHVHNTVPLISPSIYYAAWAEHVPVVQTVHNYRFVCPNGVFYRDGHVCEECLQKGLFRSVRHGCYRHSRAQSLVLASAIKLHRLLGTYRRIDACVCLTAFAKDKLCKVVPPSHIYVRPNFAEADLAPIPYAAHGEDYVFLGRLDAEKGVWVLLRAFEKPPQRRLTVIGSGPEEAAMRDYIAMHRLANVRMTGALPHTEAIRLVANARALIMPTQLYEGLPLTVLEAFALGTPVIGSALGAVQAVIEEYGGGFLFDQTNPDALAGKVAECALLQLAEASREGLLAAATAFDPEKSYAMLMQIYEAAAKRLSEAK